MPSFPNIHLLIAHLSLLFGASFVTSCAIPAHSETEAAELPSVVANSGPTNDSTSFTPARAIDHALANNPELRAARYQIAVAQANLKWAGRLNDPEFELGANTDQWGLNDNESLVEVALSQKFPLTDRLKRERNLSEVDLALAKAEVHVAEWNLAAEVRQATVDALALQRQIRLRQELKGVLAELAGQIEEAFQVAEASPLDLTEAKLEVETQTRTIRELEAELVRVMGGLRGLLGLPPESAVAVSGNLDEPSGYRIAPDAEVLAQRPDLQLSLLQQRRAEASIALARSRRWQDVAVRLFLERDAAVDEPEGLERNTFVGVGFSLPLPLRTPEARLTDAPRQELAAAEASTDALAAMIRNDITTANEELAQRRQAWAQVTAETLPLARQNVREVRESYRLGKEGFVRLQRAQERALDIEESAIEALHQYHLALARLRKAAAADVSERSD
tara:strand:- start:8165 stop:9511 length:1347 start_codon:yes stop_codon:yes gene_type:complete